VSTTIEWAEETWNPTRGCSPVSPGCRRCYAERQAHRMSGAGGAYQGLTVMRRNGRSNSPRWTGKILTVRDALDEPRHWAKPREIFVDSMSDLFHKSVPDGFIMDVWRVMAICYWHTFIILTKRAERMRDWITRFADVDETDLDPKMARGPEETRKAHRSGRAHLFADMLEAWGPLPAGAAFPTYDWMEGMRWLPHVLPNVVLGVSCESQRFADERLPLLLNTPAAVRVISAEPLLGSIDFRKVPRVPYFPRDALIHGVIVGGESGPGSEPVAIDLVRSIRDQCADAGVDFFFKQWGGYPKAKSGRVLDGRTHDALPWRRT
jgi:protein gp37